MSLLRYPTLALGDLHQTIFSKLDTVKPFQSSLNPSLYTKQCKLVRANKFWFNRWCLVLSWICTWNQKWRTEGRQINMRWTKPSESAIQGATAQELRQAARLRHWRQRESKTSERLGFGRDEGRLMVGSCSSSCSSCGFCSSSSSSSSSGSGSSSCSLCWFCFSSSSSGSCSSSCSSCWCCSSSSSGSCSFSCSSCWFCSSSSSSSGSCSSSCYFCYYVFLLFFFR